MNYDLADLIRTGKHPSIAKVNSRNFEAEVLNFTRTPILIFCYDDTPTETQVLLLDELLKRDDFEVKIVSIDRLLMPSIINLLRIYSGLAGNDDIYFWEAGTLKATDYNKAFPLTETTDPAELFLEINALPVACCCYYAPRE